MHGTMICAWLCGVVLVLVHLVLPASAQQVASPVPRYLRGVAPADYARYRKPQFKCGALSIDRDSVNDDYCDCADGSDEPGTSACPSSTFYCVNEGHIPARIPSMRVNDGICEGAICCDGSDEWQRGEPALCPSTCEQVHLQHEKEQAELNARQSAGMDQKREYIQHGARLRAERQSAAEQYRRDLDSLKAQLVKLNVEKENAAQRELDARNYEKHNGSGSCCKRLAKLRLKLEKLRDQLQTIDRIVKNSDGSTISPPPPPSADPDDDQDDARHREDLYDEEDDDDAAPLSPAESWSSLRDSWAALDLESFRSLPLFTDDSLVVTSPNDTDSAGSSEQQPRDWSQTLDESYDNCVRPIAGWISGLWTGKPAPANDIDRAIQDAADAKAAWEKVNNQIRDVEGKLSAVDTKLARDYGKEQEFAKLDGECFDVDTGEYVYEICPFGAATQKQSGRTIASLGSWSDWEASDNYRVMRFTGGAQCWNGPARSAVVKMSCGATNKLLSVTEPNKCEYEMEFETPCVCQDTANPKSVPHDEL